MSSIIPPRNPGADDMPEDAGGQLANLFHHVGEMLEVGGAGWEHIVKMTFYVPDLKLRDPINAPWVEHFPDANARPARHTQLAAGGGKLHQLRLRGVRRVTVDASGERTGGELVVEGLRRWGVDVVFGLPGVQLDGMYEGFALEPSIRVIHTRHEQATSYMADGYSRVTGRVGVCAVVPGPGVLNAAAGLATAYACGSRVLCIVGQVLDGGPRSRSRRAARDPGPAGDAQGCHRTLRVRDASRGRPRSRRRGVPRARGQRASAAARARGGLGHHAAPCAGDLAPPARRARRSSPTPR